MQKLLVAVEHLLAKKNIKMKKILFLLLIVISAQAFGQQNIGGVINRYANVVEVDYCKNTISIPSSLVAQFSVGDKILIIQMKGASLKEGNNNINNGEIDDYNSAGNWEFNEIKIINSGANAIIELKYELEKSYEVDGFVQIVNVPQYTDVNITNTLTCQNWDGLFGGILVFEASGTISMNANIDLSGSGFRGGVAESLTNPCFGINGYSGYSCEYSLVCGAKKGEGVGDRYESEDLGRAPNANGGGGGNDHNACGGGGGAYGEGGKGGFHNPGCNGPGGIGGLELEYNNSLNKIFFTGAGGAGDANSLGPFGHGTNGGNAGGLVYITANSITQNGFKIISNGIDVTPYADEDGAGGGGAGGIVVLDINNYPQNIDIELRGGRGGDVVSNGSCPGVGGGGSGGIVWISQSSSVANISLDAPGGAIGSISGGCTDVNDAQPGEDGGFYFNFTKIEGDKNFEAISLVAGNDTTLCGADGVPLWANVSTSKDYDFIWTWSSGSETEEDFTFNPEYSGNYQVVASASFEKFGISCEEIYIVNVGINKPHISIETSSFFGDTILIGEVFFLNALITPTNENYSYSWTPSERVEPNNTRNTIATPYETGEYCLTVIDENACSNTECITLFIYEPEIFSPDAFTPNNDDLNNTFFPIITEDLKVVSFKIYNRWGDLVYETNEKDAWNGKKDGIDLASDMYIWNLEVIQDLSNNTFYKMGNISIVR